MRSLSRTILATFASPAGVFVLAALDSTLFFSWPFGIDTVVVVLAARRQTLAWIVPVLAAAGSLAGAALTYWMGRTIGDKGLSRYVSERRLERVRARISDSGAIALGALDLIPPPFPFTPFVLAAGALEVDTRLFFITLAVARLLRFGAEAALAVLYGHAILGWLESAIVENIVLGCIVVAIGLTAWSIFSLFRSKTAGRRSAPLAPAPAERPRPQGRGRPASAPRT
jgi:membrane protein YqaA with SNARE-associated domain